MANLLNHSPILVNGQAASNFFAIESKIKTLLH